MNLSNLSLRQLRAFDAVAQEGSFTLAAQRLHLTQSALSVLVRELERELGVQLFDRHTRRVELADAGRDFLPSVRRVLNELSHGIDSVADLRDKKKGMLRVSAPQLMACTLIPRVVARYRGLYPDVDIRLQDTLPEHLLASVQRGDVELAVGPDTGSDDHGLVRRPLLRDRHWLICRADDPLAARRQLRWSDLGQHAFVAPTRDFVRRLRADLGAHVQPLLDRPGHEVSYMTTALGLVAAGMGVTLCPTYAQPLIKAYRLRMLALQAPIFYRVVSVYSQPHKALSPAAAAFVACLEAVVETSPAGESIFASDDADKA